VLAILRRFCALEGHTFWPDDVSLRDVVGKDAVVTHGQITDIYLLALAVQHGAKLATFDRRLAATAIAGGRAAIELIPSP
jgi:predicted nucleic acid-binding protein